MHILNNLSFRGYFTPAILALILNFGFLSSPAVSFAQTGAATPEGGLSTAASSSPVQPKPTVESPEGEGKAIAIEFCQDCHKLTNVVKARKGPDDWHDTVQTMMDRGARLPQDKFETLVQYLAKNFGPQSPAPAPGNQPAAASPNSSSGTAPQAAKAVELPEGDGKAIATEYCQACHKLTNLTKAHKDRDDWRDTLQLMMDRGASLPQDKVDPLVEYLTRNFGPKAATPPAGTGSPDSLPATSAPAEPAK